MTNDARSVRRRAAIVGIGTTRYARNLGMSERESALLAIRAAVADAGLKTTDVDAIYKVDMDTNTEADLARILGVRNLRGWGGAGVGGGAACAPVVLATMAIATGLAEVAVAFRARHRGSIPRPWAANQRPRVGGNAAFEVPYGLASPVQQTALAARRYLHRYGATSEDFAKVAVVQRENASVNPRAIFRDPITIEDVLASRMIADPLHLLDCTPETDGACAVVLTTPERARALRPDPVFVLGISQATGGKAGGRMALIYDDDPHSFPGESAASALYAMAGVGPVDIDIAMVYDMFTPAVLWQLESWGFCNRGEAAGFVAAGGIEVGGSLPVNTHGGSLSEGYVHGFNHILEAVRQLRGTANRQVVGAKVALVAAAPIVPTSAVILEAA